MADIETDTKSTTHIWVGWNSNLIPKDDETQKSWCLSQICPQHLMQALLKH